MLNTKLFLVINAEVFESNEISPYFPASWEHLSLIYMNWPIFNNKQKKHFQKKYGFRLYLAVHSDLTLRAKYEKKEKTNKTKQKSYGHLRRPVLTALSLTKSNILTLYL